MINTVISHYKILEKLGEGGMGVVYKAQDTTLDRMVALKFLPDHVAASEQDSTRFLQEARAAAALNHPNICTIHSIDNADGRSFIVMEFVDGQMLLEKKSSLPLKQAIDFGIQIAEGLAAAHEKGVVHRDIKPENIMVRRDGIVQVMDFGLAKLRGATRLTKEGSTVGTAGYMSPEQVQGLETDHRSDIFSLGVLLYEMMTGQLPFKGVHETAIAYEIVNVDSAPMSSIKPEIPPELDAIVLECLEKDPKERTQSASQVALDLKRYRRESSRSRASRITAARPVAVGAASSADRTIATEPSPTSRIGDRKTFTIIGIVAVVAIAAGFGIARFLGTPEQSLPPLRTSLESASGQRFDTDFGGNSVISPDGSSLAFVGVDSAGKRVLYVKPLAARTATALPGTQGAVYPFWSPDNRSIGFFASGKLKRVDISGNPPIDIAVASNGRGGTWNKDGIIVFAPDIGQKDLHQVSASGGTPTPVTNHDSTKAPRFPFFLPDGKHFLYVRMRLGAGGSPLRDDYQAYVGSLDGQSQVLSLRGVSNIMYASGYLVYLRQETLVAEAFDLGTFTLAGGPSPIDVMVNFWPARAKGDFSVSNNGILVYGTKTPGTQGEIAWSDREGRRTPILRANVQTAGTISSDGNRIAFDEIDNDQNNQDIWLYDLDRSVRTRFTFNFDFDLAPIWTPDGSAVLFSSSRGSRYEVFRKRVDGSRDEEPVASKPGNSIYVSDISPDGRFILLTEQSPTWGVSYAALDGDSSIIPIVDTKFNEGLAVFSPDGHWIAFQSEESGRSEVYVMPFRREGGKYQISNAGGEDPIWGKRGEIFFAGVNHLMSVKVDISGATPKFSIPQPLFAIGGETGISVNDVSQDGKRFLVSKSANAGVKNNLSLIVNWPKWVGVK